MKSNETSSDIFFISIRYNKILDFKSTKKITIFVCKKDLKTLMAEEEHALDAIN